MTRALVLAALAALIVPAAPLAADDEDRRISAPSISRAQAIRIARGYGMARIEQIEADDGGWEIEGWDHRGRELEVQIDRRGRVSVSREGINDDD